MPASEVYSMMRLSRGALSLALHTWIGPAPRAVVFYVHGTQSHAGWLFETGPALARMGCAVYALDRRGSGASEGPRGDGSSFRDWCDDYLEAMALARARHPSLPMLLLGQSFGAAIAAGIACDARARHDAVLLCSPLLVPRPGLDLWRGLDEDQAVRFPMPDEWFTTQPAYLEYIAKDSLMVRAITRRFHEARQQLAAHYLSLDAPLAAKPSLLIVSRKDPMVDLAGARTAFDQLTGRAGIVIEMPAEDHYLEFSPCRDRLWSLEAAFALTTGFSTASDRATPI